MDWLNRLLDDVALELAIDQQAVRLNLEVELYGDTPEARAMQRNLDDLRDARSAEQVARMESEFAQKVLK